MGRYFSLLMLALLFVLPVYLEALGLRYLWCNSLAVFGFYALFFRYSMQKRDLFALGFFIAVLLFYWIGYSFYYYDLLFLAPLIVVFVGAVYGLLFLLLYFLRLKELMLGAFLLFSYITPFGFNWFVPEAYLSLSLFESSKSALLLIIIAAALLHRAKSYLKITFLLPLFFALQLQEHHLAPPKADIYLADTQVPQDEKWLPAKKGLHIERNFALIKRAITLGKDMVVLPESAFALDLNLHPKLLERLLELSREIVIVTGALKYEEGLQYNSTYIFKEGRVLIGDKVVLVPFGEANPLPEFLGDLINDIFFAGGQDYTPADTPTDFMLKGELFRSAICYEATSPRLYKNAPNYMIAISNNAWFYPSIQPALQRALLLHYARKHDVQIYHATNYSKSEIVH